MTSPEYHSFSMHRTKLQEVLCGSSDTQHLQAFFEESPTSLFSLTPRMLRELRSNIGALTVIRSCLASLPASNELLPREGFFLVMDDSSWSQAMANIATLSIEQSSELVRYEIPAEYLSQDETEDEWQLTYDSEQMELLVANSLYEIKHSVASNECADVKMKEALTDSEAATTFSVRSGYMLLPDLLTKSVLLCAGSKRKKRTVWSQQAPLVLTNVSAALKGVTTIKYCGEELRVSDIETWAQILSIAAAKGAAFGSKTEVKYSEILRRLHRKSGGKFYSLLKSEISRLCHAHIEVLVHADSDFSSTRTTLLLEHASDGASITVEVPKEVKALFGQRNSSWFDESIYFSLKRPNVRRIYLLYRAKPMGSAYTLKDLHQYLGSSDENMSRFLKSMHSAHEELLQHKAIKNWAYIQEGGPRYEIEQLT